MKSVLSSYDLFVDGQRMNPESGCMMAGFAVLEHDLPIATDLGRLGQRQLRGLEPMFGCGLGCRAHSGGYGADRVLPRSSANASRRSNFQACSPKTRRSPDPIATGASITGLQPATTQSLRSSSDTTSRSP